MQSNCLKFPNEIYVLMYEGLSRLFEIAKNQYEKYKTGHYNQTNLSIGQVIIK